MLRAGLVASSSPLVMTRNAAMVQAAVFDAVNGIDHGTHRSMSMRQDLRALRVEQRRSRRPTRFSRSSTEVVQRLPTRPNRPTWTAPKVSLEDIAAHESGTSINSSITWGQFVADAIWTWRSTDGFTITGPAPEGSLVGEWRRTQSPRVDCSLRIRRWLSAVFEYGAVADGFAAGVSARRTAAAHEQPVTRDFNEVKTMGSAGNAAEHPTRPHIRCSGIQRRPVTSGIAYARSHRMSERRR